MSQCIRLSKSVSLFLLFATIASSFIACAKAKPHADWQPGDTVTIKVGEQELEVELALTPASQAKGLMKRESMEPNHGMLFVFDNAESRSFWMKNTWIPLDLAYIDPQGVIQEIHPLYPNNQNSVKSVSTNIQFALETNQHWFKNHQLQAGSQIDLNEVIPIMKNNGIRSPLY